jgi:hypothetical protein
MTGRKDEHEVCNLAGRTVQAVGMTAGSVYGRGSVVATKETKKDYCTTFVEERSFNG